MAACSAITEKAKENGYWQTLTLKYADGVEITARFDLPTVRRLESGDHQLLETIRKNFFETGSSVSTSVSCSSESDTVENNMNSIKDTDFEDSNFDSDTESQLSQCGDGKRERDLFTDQETKFIIEKYKVMKSQFKDPKIKKSSLWEQIKTELNDTFLKSYTRVQVEGKWKSLLTRYRRVKSDNNKSGGNRKDFKFESLLDEILLERHDISPVTVIGSMKSDETVSKMSDETKEFGLTKIIPEPESSSDDTVCFSDEELEKAGIHVYTQSQPQEEN